MRNLHKALTIFALGLLLVLGACSGDGATGTEGTSDNDTGVTVDDGGGATDDAEGDATAADAGQTDAGPTDAGSADTATAADSGATDATSGDATTTDSASTDAGDPDAQGGDTAAADTTPQKVCSSGQTKCAGAKLATCGVFEDGWIETNCFPGTTCSEGKCVPVSNNLIIVFDTSGSMGGKVPGCSASGQSPPTCDPTKNCTRMDISKQVFTSALGKIDDKVTRMALFRFPQKLYKKSSLSCTSGYYSGASTVSGEQSPGPSNQQSVDQNSTWFWLSVNETLCVRFPPDGNFKSKEKILKWMDGTETITNTGGTCSNSSSICKPVAGCDGSCCAGSCWKHTDPELRQTGGTPIGKTLFYVGEYLKNVVVIDGKECGTDKDCDNVNYTCKKASPGDAKGKCKDPARTCRETVVVLFTDGGQGNSNTFFAPWVQAKRLGHGLCCQNDSDCVGGTVENPTVCKSGKCLPKTAITGYYCTDDMSPCLPSSVAGDATYCKSLCVKDPLPTLTACASNPQHNVLRSPDGKPFGVRLNVVDISGSTNLSGSMSISIAGNGTLLGADASNPDKFLQTLSAVFDIKNKKVCNESF